MLKNKFNFKSQFKILKGGKISLVVSAMLGSAIIASAAPSGGTVTSGTATISQNGSVTNIDQSTAKATINWQTFSIATGETVNFNQPSSSSITLNRVIGNEKSIIDGALNANGQVWLLNSNGVLFSKNASINTSGILVTTAELSDSDFNTGNYDFKNSSSNSVINQGTINVSNAGSVVLASNEVINEGTIKAVKGKIHLVGADSYSLNLNGNSLVNLTVNKGVLDALVQNSGHILADGGEIYLTTNAVDELLKGVVNNTGIIEANSIDSLTGYVELFAHGGTAEIDGSIEANEGFVETSGRYFSIEEGSSIKAGEWLIDPTDITIDDASAYETSLNAGTNVTIETQASGSEDGNININDEIEWSTANTLTFKAHNNININKEITATNDTGKLALHYGQANVNANNDSTYNVNAAVNLKAGNNFETKLGSDGTVTSWKVIAELGNEGSTTKTDLQGMNGDLTGNYVLGSDIDATSTFTWNNGTGWTPIGATSTQFSGSLDGLGHSVDSLYTNYSSIDITGVGLFGVTSNSTIKNIRLIDSTVYGNEQQSGGLVGNNGGLIYNSSVTGTITASSNMGGLVGLNKGIIDKSFSTNSIYGWNRVGGLAGVNNSIITNSYSTSNIISEYGQDLIGGLVGENSGSITNSYSIGSLTTNNTMVGGLVGGNHGSIIDSYSSGNVTGDSKDSTIGGVVGKNFNSIVNSFYDKETNIETIMNDISLGKTKAEITALVTNKTWDTNIWGTNGSEANGYVDNNSLPFLKGVTETLFKSGFGTVLNPYIITNWTELQNINNSNILKNNKYFNLANSIDNTTSGYSNLASSMANSNKGWEPIGNSSQFRGTFDGLGNSIDGLYISRPDENNIGLFAYIYNSTIQNIGVVNANITGNNNTGLLVGYNRDSSVKNSYSTGSVFGVSSVGGLIGNFFKHIVSNSYSTANVVGSGWYVGGLIGHMEAYSEVSNSYATGNVVGDHYVGGLSGLMKTGAKISNSYSTGKITGSNSGGLIGNLNRGTVTNSFWNTETSGQATSLGGTGKTTAQMKTISTFTDAGWDISGADDFYPTLSSGSNIWSMTGTYLNYTLSDILTGNYIYNSSEVALSSLWNSSTIFGNDYNSWTLGTDYNFVYDASVVTGFINADTYSNISIDILKSGFKGASSGNTEGSLVIDKKAITVSADDLTKVYGQTDAALTYTANGLETGDTLAGSLKRVAGENVNSIGYTISEDTALANSNYTVTFTDGKYTITPRDITLVANESSKVYGSSESKLTATISSTVGLGLASNDVLEDIIGILSRKTGETIGSYDVLLGDGEKASNYSISYNSDNNSYTITPSTTNLVNVTVPTAPAKVVVNNNPNIVSHPAAEEVATQIVTLSEIRTNQETTQTNDGSQTQQDVRVPISKNSIIELVNGGVNLPDGVDQQFFVVANETLEN